MNVTATDIPNVISGNYTNTFRNCSNLQNINNSIGDWQFLVSNTNLTSMFQGCSQFNADLTNWNTSNVTNMGDMFRACSVFNQNLGSWDVSSVTDMGDMFRACSVFNQNLGSWDVSSVTDFSNMFFNANLFNNGGNSSINNWILNTNLSININMGGMFSTSAFNQPIGNWDTVRVNNMSNMFASATNFNQNLSNWDVSNVTNMSNMFSASGFNNFNNGGNSGINNWDVSNVTNMQSMFSSSAFNQPINNWDISNVTNFNNFMFGKSPANYTATNLDAIYNTWSTLIVNPGLTINFGTIKHTAAGLPGKGILAAAPNNWIILDGGI
jgi:surface protein